MPDKYEILYLPSSTADLEEAIAYLSAEYPNNAGHILEGWDRKIARLAAFPLSGTLPRDDVLRRMQYRFLVLDSYLVFYLVDEDSRRVIIHRIVHGKRNYRGLLFGEDEHA